MAKEALRVLGCAYKIIDHEPTKEEMKDIENNLIFLGMVGMIDPPREEAKIAVEKCKTAGIKNSNDYRRPQSYSNSNSKSLGNFRKRK